MRASPGGYLGLAYVRGVADRRVTARPAVRASPPAAAPGPVGIVWACARPRIRRDRLANDLLLHLRVRLEGKRGRGGRGQAKCKNRYRLHGILLRCTSTRRQLSNELAEPRFRILAGRPHDRIEFGIQRRRRSFAASSSLGIGSLLLFGVRFFDPPWHQPEQVIATPVDSCLIAMYGVSDGPLARVAPRTDKHACPVTISPHSCPPQACEWRAARGMTTSAENPLLQLWAAIGVNGDQREEGCRRAGVRGAG